MNFERRDQIDRSRSRQVALIYNNREAIQERNMRKGAGGLPRGITFNIILAQKQRSPSYWRLILTTLPSGGRDIRTTKLCQRMAQKDFDASAAFALTFASSSGLNWSSCSKTGTREEVAGNSPEMKPPSTTFLRYVRSTPSLSRCRLY